MKKLTLLAFIVSLSLAVVAHEFWLQPAKFKYQIGESATVSFRVGENFTGENWTGSRAKVKSLELFQQNRFSSISSMLGNIKSDSLSLSGLKEGTAMIAYNGLNSFIELEAAKFNAYLKEDGLNTAIEYRKTHDQTDSMGREFYQRSVKTIIQVGEKLTSDHIKPTKLPLDIIPLNHPYSIYDSARINFRIFFKGKPFTNRLCKIWYFDNGNTKMKEITSNKRGEISVLVTATGRWMVSSVNMIRSEEQGADWQSYWGSVTWGYY